jgi:hypothetical protein
MLERQRKLRATPPKNARIPHPVTARPKVQSTSSEIQQRHTQHVTRSRSVANQRPIPHTITQRSASTSQRHTAHKARPAIHHTQCACQQDTTAPPPRTQHAAPPDPDPLCVARPRPQRPSASDHSTPRRSRRRSAAAERRGPRRTRGRALAPKDGPRAEAELYRGEAGMRRRRRIRYMRTQMRFKGEGGGYR